MERCLLATFSKGAPTLAQCTRLLLVLEYKKDGKIDDDVNAHHPGIVMQRVANGNSFNLNESLFRHDLSTFCENLHEIVSKSQHLFTLV